MARFGRRAVLGGAAGGLAGLTGCAALRDALDGSSAPDARTTATDAAREQQTTATGARVYPRRVVVENLTASPLYVTVAVTRDGDPVYAATRQVPAGGDVRFQDVVSREGVYEVAVETTTGRSAIQRWPVSPALSDLTVRIGPTDVAFRQDAYCDPTCPPLSRGGTAATLPYYGDAADNPLYYGATLSVENRSGGRRRVRVVVRRDDAILLDYRYRVPDGVTLSFPGFHVADVYDVRVATDVGTARDDWHLTKERYLTATITESGVDVGCGESTATLLLVNDDDVPHKVTVRARPHDRDDVVFRGTYVVQPGASRREPAVFSGTGHYRLTVRLASGPETTYDWWLCQPRGPTEIRVGEDGSLSVIQLVPAE